MKIVYSQTHRLHAPRREMGGETSTFYPHHEIPQRAERIYSSAEILYVSLHADPNFAFPCFSGYRNERGQLPGGNRLAALK